MNVAYVSSVIALPQVPFIPDQSLALRKTNMRNGMLLNKKKKKRELKSILEFLFQDMLTVIGMTFSCVRPGQVM